MLWSILIAAIPERFHSVQPLLYNLLEKQMVARIPDIELVYLLDNRRRVVGAKRNDLLGMARGEYISFIDDDDEVAADYVSKIHGMIIRTRREEIPADVICIPQRATLQPHNVIHDCTYSIEYWKDREPDKRRQLAQSGKEGVLLWTGPPAHTMVWRRAILEGIKFPEKNFGEDVDFVDQACANAKTEVRIVGDPLYFYQFNEGTTATR